VEYIGRLYRIEKDARTQIKDLTPEILKTIRQEKSVPVLNEFKAWLETKSVQVPPTCDLGEAISYCLGQWGKLELFITDGNIPLDNNPVENAIRPFVVGRKNWRLAGSPTGAEASAFMYSLIETAKANGLEPYWYLFSYPTFYLTHLKRQL
jgi:transposase